MWYLHSQILSFFYGIYSFLIKDLFKKKKRIKKNLLMQALKILKGYHLTCK